MGKAGYLVDLPSHAFGQLSHMRHSSGSSVYRVGADGRGRGNVSPHRNAGNHQRTECESACGSLTNGFSARPLLRVGGGTLRTESYRTVPAGNVEPSAGHAAASHG